MVESLSDATALEAASRDRQRGVMPSRVVRREDCLELWAAFRRHVGIGWTSERVLDFIAGWDAAKGRS